MTQLARYAKATAEPGQGDRLAELLLQAAEGVRKAPGRDLYIVNRVSRQTRHDLGYRAVGEPRGAGRCAGDR
ncbi:MAG: hypothetical protein ACR2OB_13230 [Solirubrobacteraceae bacterium]